MEPPVSPTRFSCFHASQFFVAALLFLVAAAVGCQQSTDSAPPASTSSTSPAVTDSANTSDDLVLKDQIVEASCGQCQFGMDGDGCDLAIRYQGQAWFVEGTSIDEHGNAHADDGFCNAIRMARVTGKLEGDRFLVESFELVDSTQEGDQRE